MQSALSYDPSRIVGRQSATALKEIHSVIMRHKGTHGALLAQFDRELDLAVKDIESCRTHTLQARIKRLQQLNRDIAECAVQYRESAMFSALMGKASLAMPCAERMMRLSPDQPMVPMFTRASTHAPMQPFASVCSRSTRAPMQAFADMPASIAETMTAMLA